MTDGSRPIRATADDRAFAFARRLALTTVGLAIFSVGMVLNLQANVGLGPWPAFSYGLLLHVPMSFGQASMLIGAGMIGLSWLLGVQPGLATAMNILITGLATDALLASHLIEQTSGGLDGYAMLLLGVAVQGFGTAVYVKGNLGAGPRDSFMLGLAARIGGRVGLARNLMDGCATLIGWLLGAQVGLGTAVFALTVGPTVALWFRLLRVTVKRRPARRGASPPIAPSAPRSPEGSDRAAPA